MERSQPGLFKILHNKNIINKKEDVDDETISGSNHAQEEPNSPTISCVGKVKPRKKCEKNLHLFFRRKICPFSSSSSTTAPPCRRKKPSVIKPVFYLTEDDKIPKNMRNNNNVERKPGCKLRAMWKLNNSRRGTVSKFDWSIAVSNSEDCNTNYKEESRPSEVSGDGCKLKEKTDCLMGKMNRSVACRRGGQLAHFDWKTIEEAGPSENKVKVSGDGCKLREKTDCLMSKMNRSVACRRGGRLANFDWKAAEEHGPDDRVDGDGGDGESYCKKASSACLRKMNRSTACRRGGALSNFDWRRVAKEEEEDEEGDDVIAPVFVEKQQLVAGEPIRTEINLWQRRTFAKPLPIQLIAPFSILTSS